MKSQLPPVICSTIINDEFIGAFDNPFDLLKAFDQFLNKPFKSLDDLKENEDDDPSIELSFSLVNSFSRFPEPIQFNEESICERDDIKRSFDAVISSYKMLLFDSCSINNRFEDYESMD